MFLWVLFIATILADQLTKYWVMRVFERHETVPVVPGFFDLTLVYNPGAAFGIFSELPDEQRRLVLIAVSVIALLVIWRLLIEDGKRDPVIRTALFVVLAGAIGNIIDRIRFDAVVDFLSVYYGKYQWPAFNIADSAICVGLTILAFRFIFPVPDSASVSTTADIHKAEVVNPELGKA